MNPSGWFRASGTADSAEMMEVKNLNTEQTRLKDGRTVSPISFVTAAADTPLSFRGRNICL